MAGRCSPSGRGGALPVPGRKADRKAQEFGQELEARSLLYETRLEFLVAPKKTLETVQLTLPEDAE
jgi:hypothetical protein